MNRFVKIGLVGVTLAAIVAGVFINTTFSKYTNKVVGDGETQIAKWSFKVNEETEQFTTIKLAETYDKNTLTNGKIAPGAKGSFDLIIDSSTSEVGVDYMVDFKNETNKPTNLIYKFKDNTVENIEELEQYLTGTINANDENKVRTLTIEWEWPYGDKTTGVITKEDEIDTTEGLKALDYTFDVEVTGVQVVPSK